MKRIGKLLIFILLTTTLFALISCDDKPQPKTLDDVIPELHEYEAAVIVKNGEDDYEVYVVDFHAGDYLYSSSICVTVLAYLQHKEGLVVDWTESQYGMYINAIGGITPDASKNEYVEVFTSNPDYQGTWAGVAEIKAGELTLKSACVGISALQVGFGDVIYFELATY